MKIQNDTLQALLTQQEQLSRSRAAGTDFSAALSTEMAKEQAAVSTPAPPPGVGQASLVGRLLMSETASTTGTSVDQAFSQASGALDMWDTYITQLGDSSQHSLRGAYTVLEGLDAQISALRHDAQELRGQHAGLDDLVNRLSILTTTEKFKFNRGDYSDA